MVKIEPQVQEVNIWLFCLIIAFNKSSIIRIVNHECC